MNDAAACVGNVGDPPAHFRRFAFATAPSLRRLTTPVMPHEIRMISSRVFRLLAILGLAFFVAGTRSTCVAQSASPVDLGLPVQKAAAAGFAEERLQRAERFLQKEIDANRYAGAVWLVARDGRVVTHGAVGMRDLERREAMSEDSAFKIYSMTKIITSVAVLSLLEEGRFNLDDNVSRYLPRLGKMMVLTGGTVDAPQLVAAKRPITIRHLLTHTAGFGYDVLGRDQVLRGIYTRAELWKSTSLDDFVTRAARLPLQHQPGDSWTYGINTDILGALVEAVAGQPFETVLRERIFGPLGMTETMFRPAPAIKSRLATIHQRTKEGGLKPETPFGVDFNDLTGTFASGGGGLVSTLHDYARFAQMLANGGELGGVRVLGRKTVELMTRNHIGHLNPHPAGAPAGFGLGVQVATEAADAAKGLYSPGQFGWSGAASTYVTIDPQERVVVLLLQQHLPNNEDGIHQKFTNLVYQALVK